MDMPVWPQPNQAQEVQEPCDLSGRVECIGQRRMVGLSGLSTLNTRASGICRTAAIDFDTDA